MWREHALGNDHDREYAGMEREEWGTGKGEPREEKINREQRILMT
jgi:hypothetical protein